MAESKAKTRSKTHADEDIRQEADSPLVLAEPTYEAPSDNRWRRFFKRLMMVLLRPAKFWERLQEEEDLKVSEIMWPHAVVMIGFRSLAGFIGSLLSGAGFVAAIASFFSSFISWFALVWVFALVVGSVATARGARLGGQDPLRFAAYGLAPIFVVGVFAAVPLPYVTPIAELIAMPYTFHVLGLGVVPVLGVPLKRAPAVVGLLCGLLLVLWGIMPTLVPLAVEAITK